MQVILKSGSNETHGGSTTSTSSPGLRPTTFFRRTRSLHTWSITTRADFLGGHILRNKLFYFGSYEGDFNNSANSGVLSIPNAAQLSGNMTGSASPIYDPATSNPDGNGITPFPGNLIPASRFDPIALKIIPNIPATNVGGRR